MTERERREERQRLLGPDIDADGRRMDGQHGNDGPRRVGELRAERESRGESRGGRSSSEVHRREDSGDGSSDSGRGTSWLSVIFGWLAALGAGLILSGIVGAIVGAIIGDGGSASAAEGGTAGLIGLLITLLSAFIIGGYVAGRLACRGD